jgi:hypothetical protein
MVIKCLRYVPANNIGFAVFHPPMIIISFVSKPERSCLLIFVWYVTQRPLRPSCGTPRRNKGPSHRLIPDIIQGAIASKSQSLDPGGPGQLSRYSDSLRDGRSGDGIPVGVRFSAPVQTGPGAHPASYTVGTGSFPGVKWPGRDVDHPNPSSAEVKARVELYLYSPSGPSWPVLGRTLPLPLPLPRAW